MRREKVIGKGKRKMDGKGGKRVKGGLVRGFFFFLQICYSIYNQIIYVRERNAQYSDSCKNTVTEPICSSLLSKKGERARGKGKKVSGKGEMLCEKINRERRKGEMAIGKRKRVRRKRQGKRVGEKGK